MKRSRGCLFRMLFLGLLPVLLFCSGGWSATTPSAFHAVQVEGFTSKHEALKSLETLRSMVPEGHQGRVRLVTVSSGYGLIADGFDGYLAAQPVFQKVRKFFPQAFVLRTLETAPAVPVVVQPTIEEVVAAAPEVSPALGMKAEKIDKRVEKTSRPSRNIDKKTGAPQVCQAISEVPEKEVPATPAPEPLKVAEEKQPVVVSEKAVTEPPVVMASTPDTQKVEPLRESVVQNKKPSLSEAPPSSAASSDKGYGPWLGYGLLAALPFAVGYSGRRKRGKKGRAPMFSSGSHEEPPAVTEPSPRARLGLPSLSREWELRIQKNQRELGSAEGNLHHAARDAKTIYVTSCFHGEGKTTAAVSLALALAEQSTRRVLLIDGNTHSPQLHSLFGTECSPGLSDLRTDEMDLSTLFRETVYSRLTLVTLGDTKGSDNAVENNIRLLNSFGLREHFDYIIVDGHSALGSSHVSLVAQYFDGMVLAVECEKTKWEVVQQVKDKIEQVGGKVIGVVLNKRKYYIPRLFYGRK